MTIEEAATELMKTYSRFGVDKKELIRMMKNGVRNYDLTVASTFHGLRMMLSEQFHTQELFSQRDIAEIRAFPGGIERKGTANTKGYSRRYQYQFCKYDAESAI